MVPALFVLEVGVIVVVAMLTVEETLPGGVGKGVKGPLDGLFGCCKGE